MGGNSSGATASLFFGIVVRTRSLLHAALADRFCWGARDAIKELRDKGSHHKSAKAVMRVPVELWDRIEEEVVQQAYEDGKHLPLFPLVCYECRNEVEVNRCWHVTFADLVAPASTEAEKRWLSRRFRYGGHAQTEEQNLIYNEKCRSCGRYEPVIGDDVGWAALLSDETISELVRSLLEPYQLCLAAREQYDRLDSNCGGVSTGSCMSLPWYATEDDNDGNEGWCQTHDESDEEASSKHFMLEAAATLPDDAEERFSRLLKDWPQLELIKSDGRMSHTPQTGAEVEDEKKVRPSWRVFLRASPTWDD